MAQLAQTLLLEVGTGNEANIRSTLQQLSQKAVADNATDTNRMEDCKSSVFLNHFLPTGICGNTGFVGIVCIGNVKMKGTILGIKGSTLGNWAVAQKPQVRRQWIAMQSWYRDEKQ